MSEEDKGGRDVYYIVGLVVAGMVIVGLVAGIATMVSRKRKAEADLNRLTGFKAWVEGRYGKADSKMDGNAIMALGAIRSSLANILQRPKPQSPSVA